MKQVVFNVGGALSSYVEFGGKTLLVDIGKSNDFNPIIDFLLPLYKQRKASKSKDDPSKYHLDQLLISHPHKDHISAIEDFDKYFYSELLTTPNDNEGMEFAHKINWNLIGNDEDSSIIKLKEMLQGRKPPLRAACDQNEFIYYLPPELVEINNKLMDESYCNNISIVIFLLVNQHRVFFAGDMQKEGMKELIHSNHFLKNKLKGGVDVLIAPHHGLKSSFSTELYDHMKNNKTRCLHIVSEKVSKSDDKRKIDTRYSCSNFCSGENNLTYNHEAEKCYQVKTSRGHIFIDYSSKKNPSFEICSDIDLVIKKFL